ncbi:hypothetical protein KAW18_00885 [candidate division WOR-3 bacterium]|nr:hypothetical protein [candidate division WOR-3 bacterium]MCK4525895.1 hypothetical protein [candidate division WOR-3 bacterium]
MVLDDIRLMPLQCPGCGKEINSKEEDCVYFCSECGKGFQIIENKFKKVDVIYAKPEIEISDKQLYYLPMWQLMTTISIKDKYTLEHKDIPEEILKNRQFTSLLTSLFKEKDARKKMIFFVPAFGVTNRYQLMDHPGFQFTVDPPRLKGGAPVDMIGAEYSLDDAKEIAKVMFLSIQAHTRSVILDADIDFEFRRYRIAGIPFFEEEGLLVDGIKGFRIFKDALKSWDEIKEGIRKGGK